MQFDINRRTRRPLFTTLLLGGALVVVVVMGAVFATGKLDTYVRTMYQGNTTPIGHLANIRWAETNIRRLQWRIFALRESHASERYAKEIRDNSAMLLREWQQYYPEGITSPRERLIAEKIKTELPKAMAINHESLRRLGAGDYEGAMQWFQDHLAVLDGLDHLITQDINTNLEQAEQLAITSHLIFDSLFWGTVLLIAVGALGSAGMSLYWRQQRDNAERRSQDHIWLVEQVFNVTMDGIIITDRYGQITKVNPAFTQLTGYAEPEVLGKTPRMWCSGRQSPEFYTDMWRTLKSLGYWKGQVWNRKKSGDLYLVSISVSTIRDSDSSDLHYVAVCSDITQEFAEQEYQGYLATHDVLTGLPNRLLFRERLTQAIARGHRASSRVAILFLDLDHFKDINDSLGHAVGDGTLTTVAARLMGCVREIDTVARLGGDEFAIVLEDIDDYREVEPIVQKLLASVGGSIDVDGHEVSVTPSIGVSIYPDHGHTPEELVKKADQAMYEAKNAGKNAMRFFAHSER